MEVDVRNPRLMALGPLAALLMACGSATSPTPGASIASPAIVTLAPTATPGSTATPATGPSLGSFASAPCCNGLVVAPGRYELPAWMDLPLSLEVGDEWRVVNDKRAGLFMLGRGRNEFQDPTHTLVLIPTPDTTPDSVLAPIAIDPALVAGDPPVATTVAGFAGLQLDRSAKPNPGYTGSPHDEIPPGVQHLPSVRKWFATGFFWTTWSVESRLRFIALAIGEQTLLVEIDVPPGELEGFLVEADAVLQSLELRS
jgi:hypothetical protein